MKRILTVLTLMLLLLLPVFSGEYDDRVWFFSDTGTYNVSSIDLSQTFYLPRYSTEYNDTPNANNGSYHQPKDGIAGNVIGNLGCAFNTHQITFTISTDGRFVSMSDPEKYREFYVAIKPRYRNGNADSNFNWTPTTDYSTPYAAVTASDRVPSTKNSRTITYLAPDLSHLTNDKKNSILKLAGLGNKNTPRFYLDLCICMDELTSDDLLHLSETNDYVATITVSWTCSAGDDCDVKDKHQGSFIIALRGYYNTSSNKSEVFVSVMPTADAMDLDLLSISSTDSKEAKIADVELFAVTRDTIWDQKLHFYLSANSKFNESNNPASFELKHTVYNVSIPYTVIVRNKASSAVTEFDGTDTWVSDNAGVATQIPLSDSRNTVYNKQGKQSYSLTYYGDIYIKLGDYATGTINGDPVSVDLADYADPDSPNVYPNISGVYTSNIYYYIVYY